MRVLVIDDEQDICKLLELSLTKMGAGCATAASISQGKRALGRERFDLCLTDLRLPDGDGVALVDYVQRHHPALPVAVLTAYGSMESAIRALKHGAFDFLAKPVSMQQLRSLVDSARRLSHGPPSEEETSLVGESAVMRRLLGEVDKLARSQVPVYLHGESGTGKELLARTLHQRGPRMAKPFVPVNCGAIPQELVESELFGHVKGSFTGADQDREGLFQAAAGGTLFLDEIAELPMSMQVKLLRALQERSVRPIGGHRELPVDVRILSATNVSLQKLVNAGRFRSDLYYRINVIELQVPPLRERREDIPMLTEHFTRQVAARASTPPPRIDPAAMEALQQYEFPGNVRELENIIERASALCEGGVIHAADLALRGAPAVSRPGQRAAAGGDVERLEKSRVLEVLAETRWNRTQAARKLGITLRALRYRLEKWDLK